MTYIYRTRIGEPPRQYRITDGADGRSSLLTIPYAEGIDLFLVNVMGGRGIGVTRKQAARVLHTWRRFQAEDPARYRIVREAIPAEEVPSAIG